MSSFVLTLTQPGTVTFQTDIPCAVTVKVDSVLAPAATPEVLDPLLTDPTTVGLRVKNSSGVSVDYTYAASQVVRVSVGIYTCAFVVSTAGDWSWSWITTGPVTVVSNPTMVTALAGLPSPP